MSLRAKLAAIAAPALMVGGLAFAAASPASASTVTCSACVHIENGYFFGAIDATHQGTAVNTPIIMWGETPATDDPGADFLLNTTAGTVTHSGKVNQSPLNWSAYRGDTVARFEYAPFGNTDANTYIGLNGTKLALRNDNPDSKWQEFIEVPLSSTGVPLTGSSGFKNACGTTSTADGFYSSVESSDFCMLIDVGQSVNADDPTVVTNPFNSGIYSLVQQQVSPENPAGNGTIPNDEQWYFED